MKDSLPLRITSFHFWRLIKVNRSTTRAISLQMFNALISFNKQINTILRQAILPSQRWKWGKRTHPWSSSLSLNSRHFSSNFLFLSWSKISWLGLRWLCESNFWISSSVLYLILSLVVWTNARFLVTNPFVPEPRAVVSPMPLYIFSNRERS